MSAKLKKAQYYVWYLGWKECSGLSGREFTEPIVRELIRRRHSEILPKLTIEVGSKELKVTQLVEKKKGKIEKVKYPAIPCRDITYAVQAMEPDDDVVACVYLGYNASTNSAVHTHVYRCDSPDTAAIFINNLEMFMQNPEHQDRIRKIEMELARKGQIAMRPANRPDGYIQQFHNGAQNGHNTYRSNTSDDGGRFTVGSGSYSSGSDLQSPRSPLEEHVPVFGNRNSLNSSHGDKSLPRSPRGSSYNEYQPGQQISPQHPSYNDHQAGQQISPRNSNYNSEPQWQKLQSQSAMNAKREPQKMKSNVREDENPQTYDSLTSELKAKLGCNEEAPILLPPKDYDTIHRKRGNAFDMENRKCMNKDIVGKFVGVYNAKSVTDNHANGGSHGIQDNVQHHRSNSDSADQEIAAILPMRQPGDGYPSNQFSPPARPFSPGPLTKDLTKHSYFPNSGPQLPNYLQRSKSSQSGGSHSRQSSTDQSSLDNSLDRRSYNAADASDPPGKYSASKLGLAAKKPLQKHLSSPEFKQIPQTRGFYRRQSNDEGYTSMDRQEGFPEADPFSPSPPRSGRSSGSNTMRSDAAMDLAASMPAMKLKDMLNPHGIPVYIDEDDPGAFVPIDYTIAARGGKDRKALPH